MNLYYHPHETRFSHNYVGYGHHPTRAPYTAPRTLQLETSTPPHTGTSSRIAHTPTAPTHHPYTAPPTADTLHPYTGTAHRVTRSHLLPWDVPTALGLAPHYLHPIQQDTTPTAPTHHPRRTHTLPTAPTHYPPKQSATLPRLRVAKKRTA